MALLHKCPRCELNYYKDGEQYCNVCKREIKGEADIEVIPETCPECGERPVVTGDEFCIICLREKRRQETLGKDAKEDDSLPGDPLDLDEVADLEDIEVPATSDIPPSELQEIDKELGIEDKDLYSADDEYRDDELDDDELDDDELDDELEDDKLDDYELDSEEMD